MECHSIKFPLSNFTVLCTTLSLKFLLTSFHRYFLPSDPKQLILVS
jgi:hypothetical protein